MPLTNVLKKSLAKGKSTQSGSSRWAASGLILSMTACTLSTPPPPPSARPLVVGLNTGQNFGHFDAAGQAFTQELGTHSIRVGYKHGDHDFAVNWAAQRGIGVLFFLGYGKECGTPITASARQCYADRSAALAKTYGAKVQYYEVWNEWNGGFGLGRWPACKPTCEDKVIYTDLLCRTYKAVKAVRPNAIIVGGATSGVDIPFITGMLNAGAANCMDMISVHPYVHNLSSKINVPYESSAPVAVNKFVEAITAVDTLVRQKTGRTIPIAVTEDGRSDRGKTSNEQHSANYITELYNRASSIPFLEGIWWYQLEDFSSHAPGNGLLRSNNTKKPAFAAYQAAANK